MIPIDDRSDFPSYTIIYDASPREFLYPTPPRTDGRVAVPVGRVYLCGTRKFDLKSKCLFGSPLRDARIGTTNQPTNHCLSLLNEDEKTDGNQRGEDEEKSTPVYTRDAGETGDAWDAEALDEATRIASKRRRRSTPPM